MATQKVNGLKLTWIHPPLTCFAIINILMRFMRMHFTVRDDFCSIHYGILNTVLYLAILRWVGVSFSKVGGIRHQYSVIPQFKGRGKTINNHLSKYIVLHYYQNYGLERYNMAKKLLLCSLNHIKRRVQNPRIVRYSVVKTEHGSREM